MKEVSNNLSNKAQEALAEEKVFGKKITREVNLKWNNMELALERKNVEKFVNYSKDVQSLLKVLMGEISIVRDKLGGARYCAVREKEWDIARRLIRDVKTIVERQATPLSNGVI